MQIGSSLNNTMYCDAYSQSGLRAGMVNRREEDNFVLTNKKNTEISKTYDARTALNSLKEEKSLISSQALKAPAGVGEAGMAFSHITSSTTLSISEAALSLFESEKDAAVTGIPFSDDAKEETLSDVFFPMEKETAGKEKTSGADKSAETEKSSGSEVDESDPLVKAEINQLKQREQEVIAHEAAHKAVGGKYTGAISYTYTTGPDDKRYISGGEVSIRTPSSSDPEEVLRMAEIVRRAALAPANPSSQDIAVAADASQRISNARAEISKLAREEALQERKERSEKLDSIGADAKADSVESVIDESNETSKIDLSGISIVQGQKALKAYSSQAGFFQRSGEKRFSAIG